MRLSQEARTVPHETAAPIALTSDGSWCRDGARAAQPSPRIRALAGSGCSHRPAWHAAGDPAVFGAGQGRPPRPISAVTGWSDS